MPAFRLIGGNMFSLFKKKKEAPTKSERRKKAMELHGQLIKYVTERRDGNDDVVGRGGNLSVRNGELIVFSSADIIFRGNIDELEISSLMSGDGVVISGYNAVDGKNREIIAYYVYHRK